MYKKLKERVDRKWAFVSLSVLVSGLVFTVVTAATVISVSQEPDASNVESGYLGKSAQGMIPYSVSYPVFHAEKVDMALRNYAMHRVGAFLQSLGDKRSDPRNQLTIKYTMLHYGTRFATVAFHEHRQFAGAPPASLRTVLSFDLKSQRQLSIDDLFTDKKAAEALLGRMLGDYFRQEMPDKLSSAELEQYRSFRLDQLSDFGLDDKVVVVYINPHHPGSSHDTRSIAIAKDLLADVLKPELAVHDTGRIETPAVTPDYKISSMPRHVATIDPNKKMLALTFDDGPGALTPQVLDVLRQHDARATFFVIGRQVPAYAGIVKREVADGHEIGNHSWDHPNLALLDPASLQQQIDRTDDAIRQATGGYRPALLRPPQGVYNSAVASFAESRGLHIGLWNADTLDWLDRDTELVYQRIMASAGDGRVILIHDIHPTSVAAATRAIPDLVAQGYQLVTQSELNRYR